MLLQTEANLPWPSTSTGTVSRISGCQEWCTDDGIGYGRKKQAGSEY